MHREPPIIGSTNQFGQPLGVGLGEWTGAKTPAPTVLEGRYVRLEPIAVEHAEPLFASLQGAERDDLWTYRLDFAPPRTLAEAIAVVASAGGGEEHLTYAVTPTHLGQPRGFTSLYRIDPANGSIEIGGILYARELQRTPASTEATYLLMRHVFDDLGYRRLEWKLDSCNEPSARAAERLGFTYEGRHRNAIAYKGRNRDTDWYSLLNDEWPRIRAALEQWLAPANFPDGRQRSSLSEVRANLV